MVLLRSAGTDGSRSSVELIPHKMHLRQRQRTFRRWLSCWVHPSSWLGYVQANFPLVALQLFVQRVEDPNALLTHPSTSQASQALTYDELQGLTYLQVKGSGIANTCPVLEGGSSNLKDLKPGSYNMSKFCLEPTSFTVKEESQFKGGEPEFVKTKLMTRLTYTLDEVSPDSFTTDETTARADRVPQRFCTLSSCPSSEQQ